MEFSGFKVDQFFEKIGLSLKKNFEEKSKYTNFCLFKVDIKIFRKICQFQDLKTPLILDKVSKLFIDYEIIDNSLQY